MNYSYSMLAFMKKCKCLCQKVENRVDLNHASHLLKMHLYIGTCLEGRFCSYCLAQQNFTDFRALLHLHKFVLTSAYMSCVLQFCTFSIKICLVNLGSKSILFLEKKNLSFSWCEKGQTLVTIYMIFLLLVLYQFLSNPENCSTVSVKSVLQKIFFPLLHHIFHILITPLNMLFYKNNVIVTLCSMITLIVLKKD